MENTKRIVLNDEDCMEKIDNIVREIVNAYNVLSAEIHIMQDGEMYIRTLPKGWWTGIDSLACVRASYNYDLSEEMYDENGNPIPEEDYDSIYEELLSNFVDSEQNRIMLSIERQLEEKGLIIEWDE